MLQPQTLQQVRFDFIGEWIAEQFKKLLDMGKDKADDTKV